MKKRKGKGKGKRGKGKRKRKAFVNLSTSFGATIDSGRAGYFLIDDICKIAV